MVIADWLDKLQDRIRQQRQQDDNLGELERSVEQKEKKRRKRIKKLQQHLKKVDSRTETIEDRLESTQEEEINKETFQQLQQKVDQLEEQKISGMEEKVSTVEDEVNSVQQQSLDKDSFQQLQQKVEQLKSDDLDELQATVEQLKQELQDSQEKNVDEETFQQLQQKVDQLEAQEDKISSLDQKITALKKELSDRKSEPGLNPEKLVDEEAFQGLRTKVRQLKDKLEQQAEKKEEEDTETESLEEKMDQLKQDFVSRLNQSEQRLTRLEKQVKNQKAGTSVSDLVGRVESLESKLDESQQAIRQGASDRQQLETTITSEVGSESREKLSMSSQQTDDARQPRAEDSSVETVASSSQQEVPPRIEHWIEDNLGRGYSPDQLKKSLRESGGDPHWVDLYSQKESESGLGRALKKVQGFGHLFSHGGSASEQEEQKLPPGTKDWMKDNLEKGYSPDQLRASLRENGQDPQLMNVYLDKFGREQ